MWSDLAKNFLACVEWESPGSYFLSPSKIKLLLVSRAKNLELSQVCSGQHGCTLLQGSSKIKHFPIRAWGQDHSKSWLCMISLSFLPT